MANQEDGIKLFGTKISLHDHQQVIKEGKMSGNRDYQNHNPTVEKRPEKIIPCPRCKSMETKFCYFNNYNVNQPRHFCKGCQRYWTAGGALRNVPVGAGRRKAKPPGRVGYPEGYLFDGSDHQFQIDRTGLVVEGWHIAADHGGFRHVFPEKRRRSSSDELEDQ